LSPSGATIFNSVLLYFCSNEDSREVGRDLGCWEFPVYQIAE